MMALIFVISKCSIGRVGSRDVRVGARRCHTYVRAGPSKMFETYVALRGLLKLRRVWETGSGDG